MSSAFTAFFDPGRGGNEYMYITKFVHLLSRTKLSPSLFSSVLRTAPGAVRPFFSVAPQRIARACKSPRCPVDRRRASD